MQSFLYLLLSFCHSSFTFSLYLFYAWSCLWILETFLTVKRGLEKWLKFPWNSAFTFNSSLAVEVICFINPQASKTNSWAHKKIRTPRCFSWNECFTGFKAVKFMLVWRSINWKEPNRPLSPAHRSLQESKLKHLWQESIQSPREDVHWRGNQTKSLPCEKCSDAFRTWCSQIKKEEIMGNSCRYS